MEGILGILKEPGLTSHDCVFRLRKILHMKKIGHAGTLDPAVSGVLPICLGKATKVVEYLQESGKVYTGEILIGESTTTEDGEGELVEKVVLPAPLTEERVREKMQELTGTITQIPPMFSAVKVNGKRLYEYARKGETVERPSRLAEIYSFTITSPISFHKEKGTASFSFEVHCGKGTYIRTLSVDLGKKLGYPAHMSHLVREAAGGIKKENCLTLQEVADLMAEKGEAGVEEKLLPLEFALKNFSSYSISPELFQKVKNGAVLTQEDLPLVKEDFPVALYYEGKLFSLYHHHPEKSGYYKPQKVFRTEL